MKTPNLTDPQKRAFIDLLIMGMYVDQNLSSAEDARVQHVLDTFQFTSDYERQQFLDASFTRVSRQMGSEDSIRTYVTQLASNFSTRQMLQDVYEALNDVITSDRNVTSKETLLLSVVREAFRL